MHLSVSKVGGRKWEAFREESEDACPGSRFQVPDPGSFEIYEHHLCLTIGGL